MAERIKWKQLHDALKVENERLAAAIKQHQLEAEAADAEVEGFKRELEQAKGAARRARIEGMRDQAALLLEAE